MPRCEVPFVALSSYHIETRVYDNDDSRQPKKHYNFSNVILLLFLVPRKFRLILMLV